MATAPPTSSSPFTLKGVFRPKTPGAWSGVWITTSGPRRSIHEWVAAPSASKDEALAAAALFVPAWDTDTASAKLALLSPTTKPKGRK